MQNVRLYICFFIDVLKTVAFFVIVIEIVLFETV